MKLQDRNLKLQMKGDDVALCQDELKELGYEIEREEVQEERFGRSTRQAVLEFQKEHNLQTSGIVEEETAKRINTLLSGEQKYVVSGKIIESDDTEQTALAGVTVHAVDWDIGGENFLGEARTDDQGDYKIRFSPEKFRLSDSERDGPDVVVRVYNEKGQQLAESERIMGGASQETVDLTVKTWKSPSDEKDGGVVQGRVVDHDRRGLEGLRVLLVDKCVGQDIVLGETKTESRGRYRIPYDVGRVQEHHKDKPDLQIQVPTQSDEHVLSDVRYNAGPDERIDAIVPAGNLPREPEATQLREALGRHCGGASLAELQEDDERQDITYLANKTGWDARMVAMTALADQFSQSSDIQPEFLYALFRAGVPANESGLSQAPPETVKRIWEMAVDEGVIPAEARDQIPENLERFKAYGTGRLLELPASVGVSSLSELLDLSIGDDENRKQRVAELYYENQDNLSDFWGGVREEFGSDTADRLRLDGQLAFLTVNNAPLIQRVRQKHGDLQTPLDLVHNRLYQDEAWTEELLTEDVAIPEEMPGNDDGERKNNYAAFLANQLRLSYPTAVVAEMVNRDEIPIDVTGQAREEVYQFLSSEQGRFELGMHPVEEYLQKRAIKLNDEALDQVKKLQRVYQITPSNEAMSRLMAKRIDSAYAMMQYDEEEFVNLFKDELGGDAMARLTYGKGHQVHNVTLNIATSYMLERTAAKPFAIAGNLDLDGTAGAIANTSGNGASSSAGAGTTMASTVSAASTADSGVLAYPTLEGLVGEMDYCACEHCESWLSPSAYLVNLLQFIDGIRYNSAGEELPAAHEKEIPLDVLLERRPDIQHIELTCENTNTVLPYIDLVNEILEYFVLSGIDNGGGQFSLQGFEGYNFKGDITTDELMANPQFVKDEAYDHLRQTTFPPTLPFHRSLESLRRYFDHFDVPLHAAMEKLRRDDRLDRDGSEEVEYAWRDILMERLGLSRKEHAILTDSSPKLQRLGVDFRTVHDLHEGDLDETTFRDRLPEDLDEATFGGNVARWVQENFDDFMPLQVLYGEDPSAVSEDELIHRLQVVTSPEPRPIGFSNAKLFTRHLGISYEDLIEIVRTQFINPHGDLIPKLERLGVSFGVIRDFHEGVLDAEDFEDKLGDDLVEGVYGGNVVEWVKNNYGEIMRLIVLSDPTGSNDICSFDRFEMRYALPSDADRLEVGWTPLSVTHDWSDVKLRSSFATAPVVLTSMQTFEGDNPAGTRLRHRTENGFEIKVEEEQSADPEITHTEEQIGYLAVAPGKIRNAEGDVIGEAGIRKTGQGDTSAWHAVTLENRYDNPVVMMQLMSFEGRQPAHTRIRNVDTGSFEFRIEEWAYLEDRSHASEQIGYVVLERGPHRLADGTTIEVGTVDTDDRWAAVNFDEDFFSVPAVVSHCQTANDGAPVVTRQRHTGRGGVQIRIQEEEARGDHDTGETIGYIAALPASEVEAGWTPLSVTHEWSGFNLGSAFASPPVVLTSMQTFEGENPAGTRLRDRTENGFEVKIEEEQSSDPEVSHTEEQIGYLAVAPGGIRNAEGDLIGEAGIRETGQGDTSAWHAVTLENRYENPVVVIQLMSFEGDQPAHTRIRNVDAGSFEFQIEEWEYLEDRSHATEQIGYVVLERGPHRLADGTTIEVGTVDTDEHWVTVNFSEEFLSVPAVVSHCQTVNGGDPVVTRQRSMDRGGVQIRLQEEEAKDGHHNTETIGYVAVLPLEAPLDENRLRPVEFLKLLRFVRLWKKLGWTIAQTDKAIAALYPGEHRPNPDDDEATIRAELDEGFKVLIVRLAHVKRVMEALELTPERDLLPLLALWSPIDVYGNQSLYHRMFLNPAILEPDDVFQEDGYGNYLADKKQFQVAGEEPPTVADHAEALRAAFNLTQEEWTLIWEELGYGESTVLNLENISPIFRHGYLARALKFSVRELLALKSLSGVDPFSPLMPVKPDILRFIELVRLFDESPFEISDLLYFLQHEDLSGNASPKRASVLEFARRMRDDLVRINREHVVEADPNGEIAREKMVLVYGDEAADTFFSLLNHTSTYTVTFTQDEPELAEAVGQVTDRIAYDHYRKELSFRGVMTETVRSNLRSVAGVSDDFPTAVEELYDKGQKTLDDFFERYSELQEPYENFIGSDAPAEDRFSELLADVLPTLRDKLKRQQIRETVSAQVDTPLSLATMLLETPPLLHAVQQPEKAAAVDFLNLETPGVSARYFFTDDVADAPDREEVAVAGISYSSDGMALPTDPTAPEDQISGVWRWYVEAPVTGFYNFYVEVDDDSEADIGLKIEGESVTMSRLDGTWQNEEAIELEAGQLYAMQLTARSVKDKLMLKWESSGIGRESIPLTMLYPAELIDHFTITYLRVLKALTIAEKMELAAAEVKHFGTHHDYHVELFSSEDMETVNRIRTGLSAGGGIPDELRDLFQDNGIALSDDVTVSQEDENTWVIRSGGASFSISTVDTALSVGEGWLNALPASRSTTPAKTTATLLDSCAALVQYTQLKEVLKVRDDRLIELFEKPFLFKTDAPVFEGDPNDGAPSEALRQAFSDNGMSLSSDEFVTMVTQAEDRVWRIEDIGEDPTDEERTYNVIKIRTGGELTVYQKGGVLDQTTGWGSENLRAVLNRFDFEMNDLGRLRNFIRTKDAFGLIEKLGIGASAVLEGTTNDPSPENERLLQGALRARYEEQAWVEVLRPINDEVRELARDALVAFVLHKLGKKQETQHIDTPDKLFEYFLIDVQMDPCMKTSRIKQAISTVQLFIQRCLMNLEPKVASSSINAKQWEWMKRYRVWEANRKIFLWPENWLEPELRVLKSSFCEDAESELLETDITDEAAATALLHYLEKLDEVAKLEICGMYYQEEDPGNGVDEVVHVVARSVGAGGKYYYRRLEHSSWTPWQEIGLDIEDKPVLPVVWRGRLLLFWLTVMQKGPEDPEVPFSEDKELREVEAKDLNLDTRTTVEITLNWSEYYNGKWQAAKTSDINRPINLGEFDPSGDGAFERIRLTLRQKRHSSELFIWIEYSGEKKGYFRLYNTQSLPVRRKDEPVRYAFHVPNRERNIGSGEDSHLIVQHTRNYTDEGDVEYLVLGNTLFYEDIRQIIQPLHDMPNIFVAPFFFQDRGHVFFVRPIAHHKLSIFEVDDLGRRESIVPRIDEPLIPSLYSEPQLDVDVPHEKVVFPPASIAPGVVDAALVQSFVEQNLNINQVIHTGATVQFGDRIIGPGGSTSRTRRG